MGRKSRGKIIKQQRELEEEKRNPMRRDMRLFLKKKNVKIENAQGMLCLVSVMVDFMIHNSIRTFLKLPGISPEEDQADKNRMSILGKALEYEAAHLKIEMEDIVKNLVYPLTAKTELVYPIMNKILGGLDAMALSDDFRQTTENQIENPDLWKDSLEDYAERTEDYFQALKELFILTIIIIRSSLDANQSENSYDKNYDDIRDTYRILPADFLKLRRRATEFFKIAFASYLRIEFQPLRDQLDKQLVEPAVG
ncbi:MAG: hypothetical protein PHP23_15930 [Desulfobacterales bacterium]|nr:hypothetical protein [Desulfobacterales bacterium]MDD4071946.1 hypothetical protein [Desulfobacterales bacterium]MDD4393754.1 hypothetical protein [Desulfobacterales bacterium]